MIERQTHTYRGGEERPRLIKRMEREREIKTGRQRKERKRDKSMW